MAYKKLNEDSLPRFRENRSDDSFQAVPDARTNTPDYGKIIREYRKKLRVSQKQIAADFGYHASIVHAWEHGSCTPRAPIILPLCKYLHIPVAEFLGYPVSTDNLSPIESELVTLFRSTNEEVQNSMICLLRNINNIDTQVAITEPLLDEEAETECPDLDIDE